MKTAIRTFTRTGRTQTTLLRHLQTALAATQNELAQVRGQVAHLQAQVGGGAVASDAAVFDLPPNRVVRVTARVRQSRPATLVLEDAEA